MKRRRILSVGLGLSAIALSAFALFALQSDAQASTDFGKCARDNDNNAVIKNGACDTTELQKRYNATANSGVAAIYKAFGIPVGSLANAKKGEVRKNGDVVVDGKVVATGAKTAGRYYMSGSVKKVYGGHTFYERSPSVSFNSNSISAFVYFNAHGEFQAAILTACGNPVTAKPKPKPAYKCSALKVIATVDRTRFNFTVTTNEYHATAKSVTFNIYKDGKKVDSKTSTSKTLSYTQPTAGKYTVKATVTFAVNGQGNKTTTESQACSANFTVTEQPKVPSYACTGLNAIKVDRTHFTFTTSTAEQYAQFKKVTYVIYNAAGTEVDRFDATAKTSNYTRTQTGNYTVKAMVTFTVNGQDKTAQDAKCTAHFEVTDQPVVPEYACTGLSLTKIGRTNFTFTTTTSEKNATFKKVTYVVTNAAGNEVTRFDATTKTSPYVQATAGTYMVKAIVTFTVKGVDKTVEDAKCKASFTVTEAPTYSCDGLSATLISKPSDRTYKYTLTYTAKNGATLLSTDFDFGDGTSKNNVTVAGLADVTHKYPAKNDYTTTATLKFSLGDTVAEAKCTLKITTSPNVTPCPYNPSLPIGHPDCKAPCQYNPQLPAGHPNCKPEVCKYNTHLPATSKECKPPKEVCVYNAKLPADSKDCKKPEVVVIAKTGPGETMSALAGLGSLTAAGYYLRASRRELATKQRNTR